MTLDEQKSPVATMVERVSWEYFVLLDFKTKRSEESISGPKAQVITELSWLIMNLTNPENEFTEKYRASVNTQESDNTSPAHTLADALSLLSNHLAALDGTKYCFVTYAGWFLRTFLPAEAKRCGIKLPANLAQPRIFDVFQESQKWLEVRGGSSPPYCNGIASLYELANTLEVESDAADECLTMARIVRALLVKPERPLFNMPEEPAAEQERFLREESVVVRIANLPHDVSHTELDSWFRADTNLRPTTFWMVRTADNQRPSGHGLAVFATHTDALSSLSLDGSYLNDRVIEIRPGSQRMVDDAGSTLAPFPMGPRNRHRPGDWTCDCCQFHNFAARRTCLRCNSSLRNSTTPPNFAPGDWICPNPGCHFHNYASRSQCLRCSTLRPGIPPGTALMFPGNPSGGGAASGFRPGDWICPNPGCQFQNFASRLQCLRCCAPAQAFPPDIYGGYSSAPLPPHMLTFRPGDWLCPKCHLHNFASRMQCLRCTTHRPPMGPPPPPQPVNGFAPPDQSSPPPPPPMQNGAHPAPPPPPPPPPPMYYPAMPMPPQSLMIVPNAGANGNGSGLMKRGDWLCQNKECGYHNFAKRNQCAKCGGPAVAGARTNHSHPPPPPTWNVPPQFVNGNGPHQLLVPGY
ncbi:uncharacterized protein VTP21DRAFT_10973 [Calcarisporiella thermophila]|uniref:uncharacterized protein n=1 Tax=Calcarisporiella thermophila TaxID=911321 RepID=UPI0037449878